MPGVIVPRKTVTELRKLIDEIEQEVAIALSDTKIRFTFGDAVLTSKLIDGTFPDYDRVIPAGNDKILEVDLQALRRGGRPRLDHLDREEPRGEARHRARHADALGDQPGERHRHRGDRGALQRRALEIGFNSRYLLDITEQIEGEGARFAMADAASPTIVRDTRRRQRALRAHADARLRVRDEAAISCADAGGTGT